MILAISSTSFANSGSINKKKASIVGTIDSIQIEQLEDDALIDRSSLSSFNVTKNVYGYKQELKLQSKMADKTYRFQYTFPNGGYIEEAYKEGKQEGSLLFYNTKGELIASTNPLEMTDANGKEIFVHLEVNKDVVTYRIDDVNKSVKYPLSGSIQVFSDATDFYTWFSYGKWYSRSDGITLGLMPVGNWTGTDATMGEISWSWNTVKNKFGSSSNWYNEDGMYEQYYCHVLGHALISGEEWNLEPWRPKVGVTQTIANKCNP